MALHVSYIYMMLAAAVFHTMRFYRIIKKNTCRHQNGNLKQAKKKKMRSAVPSMGDGAIDGTRMQFSTERLNVQ